MSMPDPTPFVNTLSAQSLISILSQGVDKPQFYRAIKGKASTEWFGSWTVELEQWLAKLNADQWNIYYAVNNCGKEGPKLHPAQHCRCIYLDNDNTGTAKQKQALHQFLIDFPPNVTVNTSPDKYQYIWLTEALPLDIQPLAGRNAAAWLGTDKQVIDTARILRLPGYRNWSTNSKTGELKYPAGPLSTAVLNHDRVHTEADVRKAFGCAAVQPGDLNHLTDRVERSKRPAANPQGFKIVREPVTDNDPAATALARAQGLPGVIDKSDDTGLAWAVDLVTPDAVLALLSSCDPDAPGLEYMTVVWALKTASQDASWAYELADLWSSLAKQDWPDTLQSIWARGDTRSDWRTLLRAAGRSKLSAASRRELLKDLQAFKQSHPELAGLPVVQPVPEWPDKAERTGKPQNTVDNFAVVLKLADCRPRYDRFKAQVFSDGEPVDDHARMAMAGIAARFGFTVTKHMLTDYIEAVAHLNSFDSAQEWLHAMPAWDGVPRLYTALHRHLHCDDNEVNGTMCTLWMCGAVRRIMQPGCQFPTMLVIKGPQGIGKSAFFRELAGQERYNGNMKFNVDDRAISEQTRGCTIVELGELAGLGKRDREHVKNFISSEIDIARAAFAHDVSRSARRFVLAGTTNFTNLLRERDNRRWWIAECRDGPELDIAAFRAEREQLWAEAIALEPLMGDLALPKHLRIELAKVQKGFRSSGVLTEALNEIVMLSGRLVKEDVWTHCGYARYDGKARNQGLIEEMKEFMEEHGWTENRVTVFGKTTRVWQNLRKDEAQYQYRYEGTEFKENYVIREK